MKVELTIDRMKELPKGAVPAMTLTGLNPPVLLMRL